MAEPGVRRALTTWARNYVVAPRYSHDQRLKLRTSDGVDLAAVHLRSCVDPLATVVLVHGFTNWSRNPRIHAFGHRLAHHAEVIIPDLRGHGASGGRCALGRDEHHDVAAAVAAAAPGLAVVTVGVSMGAVATLRHAGVDGGIAGTVAISPPAGWTDLTTHGAARIRRYVGRRSGRVLLRALCRTRVLPGMPAPERGDAATVVGEIAPAFTLIVHDTQDRYFPPHHATQLFEWAEEPKDLWWTDGAGHGTDLLTTTLADRLLALLAARLRPRSSPSP